jgi:hypothetical protein
MTLVTRQGKGSKLTIQEMDGNLEYLEQLSSGRSNTNVEIQTLILNNELFPGAIYKITGFNKNMPIGDLENPNGFLPEVLYDDGTNNGVTIYVKALTTNTLSSSGWGEFYNPKYGDQTTYYNTDGTGLYGIWDGDNPDPLEVPEYTVDQVVFWGGYAWKNLTGNVGTAGNIVTLNSDDWEKLPYSNTTYYELVIDEVKIDWNNGIVIGRTNIENQITVEFNADQYWWWMGIWSGNIQTNPISVMGWGLYSKITPEQLDDNFFGISNLHTINSNCETVNFKGVWLVNINMDSSYMQLNYIGKNSFIDSINMTIYSSISQNILSNNSVIVSNTLTRYGSISGNTLIGSSILHNTLMFSNFIFNILNSNSNIGYNILNDTTINGVTLSESRVINNIFNNSTFFLGGSGTLSSKILQKINAKHINFSENISAATDIFRNVEKNIYTRLDGTNRLSYFNNSDTPTIVNVNA